MNISPACLPPRQPLITEQDRAHPLFREYQAHRASMSQLLVEAPSFSNWLYQREQQTKSDTAVAPQFFAWMRQNKAGARRCPAGVFPDNFKFWLDGGRW